jgi:hypothetical protein
LKKILLVYTYIYDSNAPKRLLLEIDPTVTYLGNFNFVIYVTLRKEAHTKVKKVCIIITPNYCYLKYLFDLIYWFQVTNQIFMMLITRSLSSWKKNPDHYPPEKKGQQNILMRSIDKQVIMRSILKIKCFCQCKWTDVMS